MVMPSAVLARFSGISADDSSMVRPDTEVSCLDWVLGECAAVAVGSQNGTVDILGFRARVGVKSLEGDSFERLQTQGKTQGSALGLMQLLVRVCPQGGPRVGHIVCCSSPRQAPGSDSDAGDKLPLETCLLIAKGRGIWSWVADRGLVRGNGGGSLGNGHQGNVTCLTADGSGAHVASLSADGTICLWSLEALEAGAEKGGRGGLTLVSCFTCELLSGSNALLGGALSYHGCFVALAGRRVMPQRGRQSLTFPTGIEGVLTIQRIPGRLPTASSRSSLLATVCTYMHAEQAHAKTLGYGAREPAGGLKWWWDLLLVAEKEMSAAERRRAVTDLGETRARLESKHGGAGGKSQSGSKLQQLQQLQPARGGQRTRHEGLVGVRTPLHACVRDADDSTCELLLMLAAEVDARDPKGSTALMIAAVRGHEPTVKSLLNHRKLVKCSCAARWRADA